MKLKINKTKLKRWADYDSVDFYESFEESIGFKLVECAIDRVPLDSKAFKILNNSFNENKKVKITVKDNLFMASGHLQINYFAVTADNGAKFCLTGNGNWEIKQRKKKNAL